MARLRARFFAGMIFFALLVPRSIDAASYSIPPDESFIGEARAVVVGSALRSWTEMSPEGRIVTKTTFSIEEVLKGDLRAGNLEIVVPGGVYGNHVLFIPGMPRFTDGERSLLFLAKPADRWMVYGMTLGRFRFLTDMNGHDLVVRDDDDLVEESREGEPPLRGRRDAQRYLQFIRATASRGPARRDFVVAQAPLIRPSPFVRGQYLQGLPAYTPTSYTILSNPPARGARWTTFPGAVIFKSLFSNASGDTRINAAFAAWNGHAGSNINILYSGADDGTHTGGLTVADGVNTIIYEQNLFTKYALPLFNCGGGAWSGFIGIGGYSSFSGTHAGPGSSPETFDTLSETDVELNIGVRDCVTNDMSTGLTHEVGHAISFRHADKTRDASAEADCATDENLECSSTAIMKAVIPTGVNAALQSWDQNAAAAVYPGGTPPPVPVNVVATATTTTSVSITWNASVGATSYQVFRRPAGGSFGLVGSPVSNSFTDNTAAASSSYLYQVRAVSAGGTSADSTPDLATTVIFTDDALAAGILVKAVHLSQLRTATNAVRALAGLGAAGFTDAASAGVTVKAVHVTEMRTALDAGLGPLGRATGGYTDGALGSVLIKPIHFQELRNRVK